MKITKIYINEFGPLEDYEFSPSGSLNIIEGPNESGKSSILGFIRFIFYGFGRLSGKSTDSLSERRRGLTIKNRRADGFIEIESENPLGNYRIRRTVMARTTGTKESLSEAIEITNLSSGEKIKGNPDVLFLGLSADAFDSALCAGQAKISSISSEALTPAIRNLVNSGNEGTDPEKALKTLEEIRRSLLHKNQKGGIIFDMELNLASLDSRLEKAKQINKEISASEHSIEEADQKISILQETQAQLDNYCKSFETFKIIRSFDLLHKTEKELDENKKELSRLIEHNTFDGFFPNDKYIEDISSRKRSIFDLNSQCIQLKADLSASEKSQKMLAENAPKDLDKAISSINALGGANAIKNKISQIDSSASTAKKAIAIAFSLFGIFAIIGILAFTVGFAYTTVVGSVAVSLALLCSGAGVLAFSKRKGLLAELKKLMQDVNFTGNDTASIGDHISRCLSYNDKISEGIEQHSILSSKYKVASSSLESEIASLSGELLKIGLTTKAKSADDMVKTVEEVCDRLNSLFLNINTLKVKAGIFENNIAMQKKDLATYDEATLRAKTGDRSDFDLNKYDEAVRRLDFVKEQLSSYSEKKASLERALIYKKSTAEDPRKLSCEIDSLRTELNNNIDFYRSVDLAQKTITAAGEAMKDGFSPSLCKIASEYLSTLTENKYSSLAVDADFYSSAISPHESFEANILSGGTRDAVYLSLRLALAELLSSEDRQLPIFLDEPFNQMDESRALGAMSIVRSFCGKHQCFIFTCHKRDALIAGSLTEFNHEKLL